MGATGVNFGGHAHGTGKGFEGGFNDVVGVDAIELTDVKGHKAVVDNGHKKFTHELGVVGANALGGNVKTVGEVRATGEIEGDLDQGFV